MSKAGNAAKDRWNSKTYDDLRVRIPKGRKADVEAYAKATDQTINGLINSYLRETLGMTESEWKKSDDPGEA